jgi:hypothetical protein
MEKKTENPRSESIPPTDFKPLKSVKTYIQEKSIVKKKSLDDFFTDEWKQNYFSGKKTTKPSVQ